ncbi:MAG: ABC transporter ATP-binding protein, partial [Pseudomonadota bacterium]
LDDVPAAQRPTCMVFQSLALFPHMSVGDNIGFPLKLKGAPKAERKRRALELMELLHLPADYIDKRIQQCSGGEKQRVALARALAFDPEILFFDEPLSALDYRLRKTLERELKELHQRTGKTFVYITHSLEEAMAMSDRIAILRAGRFEQIGPADEIYARPISRFVADFMGEVNLFDAAISDRGLRAEGLTIADGVGAGGAAGTGALMVRPEMIRFLAPGETADIVAEAVFDDDFMLGSRIQHAVTLADGRAATVETLRADRFNGRPGDTVRIGWSMAGAHFIKED